ncbi:MAG: beta-lactamase family protein [Streptococcaceae bacterium]|nr:beta-lactamase family protein [Streptococcaceae bacterium]
MKNITERINSYLKQGIFESCEIAVINQGNVKTCFFSNASEAFSSDSDRAGKLWDLASVTKVVGVGTVLIDRIFSGRIKLDESLQHYYPSWHEATVTIRQLLTHTSGIDPFILNRDQLNSVELKDAMNHLKVTSDKSFKYTDVNFILLGFMLEKQTGQSLDKLFQAEVFDRWKMTETHFGPVKNAFPTVKDQPAGVVHDPKARVLGIHCGSAGLFSSVSDLIKFVQGYFADDRYLRLLQDYTNTGNKARSLAWDLLPDDYLLHTGYTGTFILMNLRRQSAVIFLSNRVYYRDERQKWIKDRDLLISDFQEYLADFQVHCHEKH